MQGAATQAMSFIVEERQRSRCPPAAAPRRAAGSQHQIFYVTHSQNPRLKPRQQNVKLFLREPLALQIERRPAPRVSFDAYLPMIPSPASVSRDWMPAEISGAKRSAPCFCLKEII